MEEYHWNCHCCTVVSSLLSSGSVVQGIPYELLTMPTPKGTHPRHTLGHIVKEKEDGRSLMYTVLTHTNVKTCTNTYAHTDGISVTVDSV